jgi:dihydropteroate synthase
VTGPGTPASAPAPVRLSAGPLLPVRAAATLADGPAGPPGLPALGRARVMAVVNVTPDSFSDGGEFATTAGAVAHGLGLLADGADLLDVGGESTRPGTVRVDADEEWRRIGPVVRELAAAGAVVSVDTMRARIAERALEAGARVLNDVSGGLADPGMARVAADAGCPYVVMHWRGHSDRMQERAVYADVVREVADELGQRLEAVLAAGCRPEQVVLDPGLGFAKDAAHNWALLARLDAVAGLGRPLLVGASRKSFLGGLLPGPDGAPRPAGEREDATTAVTTLAAAAGAWAVRVHRARPAADAVRVAAAVAAARRTAGGHG